MVFIDRFTRYCGGSRILAWLLTINVVSALILWLTSGVMSLCGTSSSVLYRLFALPSDPLTFATHPWTLLTYMAAHFSPLHMLFNMLWLYWFGRMFTDVCPEWTLLQLYICGGVAGGALYIITSALSGNSPNAYLTGASASVLCIMTATALKMPSRKVMLILFGEVKLKWVALFCILLTLIGSVGTGIPAQAAHIGGIAAGACRLLVRRRPAVRQTRGLDPVKKAPRHIRTRATIEAMSNSVPDTVRLDELLDKIRISGYDSLSAKEKTELNYISSRLEPRDTPYSGK